jgi:MurNAc alpha-1-phosphate uridylyltransferase
MKAMVLAAGRGERMRPLTDDTPKPLLKAGGASLIEHRLKALADAGIRDCVINLAYRGRQIRETLGDGARLGLNLRYSDEGNRPVETAGGIIQALPLLGEAPFILVNADIWTDFDFSTLPDAPAGLAHLVLVNNPGHHRAGDFALNNGRVSAEGTPMLTYSGIGVYRPELFKGLAPGVRPLLPLLLDAIHRDRVGGLHYTGYWRDIGTPERLAELDRYLQTR